MVPFDLVIAALHCPRLSLQPFPQLFLLPSRHSRSEASRRRPSRCAATSARLRWYSGWRWAWSPRSGTHNLFKPLIIIRGINKFGMGGCSLNSELLPCAEIYLFTIFSPLLLGDKRRPSLPQLPPPPPPPQHTHSSRCCRLCSECAENPLTEWDGCHKSTYTIFRDTISILTNTFFLHKVTQIHIIYQTAFLIIKTESRNVN